MTPRRHTRALLTLPLALLLVRAGAVAAPPDDAPPSDAGKLRDLKSPKGGWIMKLPERNSVEVVLPREEAVSAGTGARQQLVFEVRLTRKPRAPVRMIFHVQNRQGWYYQTARVRGIPSDRWWRIDTDFSAGSSEWEAVGHARPWDALSARGIVRAGIRLFSQVPYRGALLVREVRWAPGGDRADGGTAVVDLRAPPGPVRPAGLWELSFRLSRPVADPFGPESAGLVCEIVTPGGDTRRAAAFIYQDYERADADGRLVALGAPEWRVRFRPSEEGRFLYRLFTGGAPDRKAERRGSPQAEGWFVVEGDGTPQEVLTREAGEVPGFERFVLEVG